MTIEPNSPGQAALEDGAAGSHRLVVLGVRALRIVMLIGIVSLLVASATLLLYGAYETGRQIVRLLSPSLEAMDNREMFLASIKLVDLILLATIMQVVGIGLYSLFVDGNLPVPRWLRTTHVDELKYKLAGIVAVMLGVLFLEQVFYWGSERELLSLGLAIAAVIVALSYFIRTGPTKS